MEHKTRTKRHLKLRAQPVLIGWPPTSMEASVINPSRHRSVLMIAS